MKKDGKKLNKKLVIGSVLIIIFLFQVVEIENLRFINISNGETIEDFVYIVDNQSNVTITRYQGNSTKVEIPETIDGKKVTGIGQSAFYNCSNIRSINISKNICSIDVGAFYNCESLVNITVNENNQQYCDIDGVLFTKEKDQLIKYPCYKWDETYIIPDGTVRIGNNAFENVRLMRNIEMPNSVEYIGDSAFSECRNLGYIEMSNGVTNIGDEAFAGSLILVSNSEEINLPEIIKRAKNENDILYSNEDFLLYNCTINNDGTKLILQNDEPAYLQIMSGKLKNLKIIVEKSGKIIYSRSYWDSNNVIATILLEEGDKVTNNKGENYYIFEDNADFTFQYKTKNGENKTSKAEVNIME